MKERLIRYWPRAVAFGLVNTLFRCFSGGLRFGAPDLPPVCFQILRIFLLSGGTFLVIAMGADWLYVRFRREKKGP